MKLTIDVLNELHVTGKISDLIYGQYNTLIINNEHIEYLFSEDGGITFSVKLRQY